MASQYLALRPRHCVLAGGSGTHSVYVCMCHQNFKLMLHSSGLKEATQELLATTLGQHDNEDHI